MPALRLDEGSPGGSRTLIDGFGRPSSIRPVGRLPDLSFGSSGGAALLLDIDGVLIPDGPPPREWGEWVQHQLRKDLVVSPQLFAEIDALGVEVCWLTSWSQNANAVLCPLIGWAPKRVLVKQTVKRWWKLVAVEEFFASSSHGRVAWVDDDLDQYADEVAASVGRLIAAARLLTVCPTASTGLTRAEVQEIRAFFDS